MLKILQVFICLAIALVAGGLKHGAFVSPTVATDDFNRANGGLGSNWVASPSFTGFTITSNTAGSNLGVFTISYWNPATNTFANDQSSQVTLLSGSSPGAVVRHQPGVSSGYMAVATGLTGGSSISIYRFDAGSFTLLNGGSGFTINPGDILVLTITGTTLVATVNGTTRNTITDSTYSSGSPGIAAFNATLDNWTGSPISVPSGDVAFLPTALYFMDPAAANDLGAGTFASPWKTPNHAVNCGDVILVKAGAITTGTGSFGTVSNCPSPNDGVHGINGTGGIYFATLLCAATDLEGCTSAGQLWNMGKNNWSVQGFRVTNTSSSGSPGRAFNLDGCSNLIHHFAFVNNIIYNASSGIHTDDCGVGNVAVGADYVAAVGNIAAHASNNNSFCEAAIDIVGPGALDTNAGTHHYIYNNYVWNSTAVGCSIDSEGIMFDAWNTRTGINYTGVIANNIVWTSDRYGIHVFPNGVQTITPTMKIYQNTAYGNLQAIGSDNADGELNADLNNQGLAWDIRYINNIAQATVTGNNGLGNRSHFAMAIGSAGSGGSTSNNVTNTGNILKAANVGGSCPGLCDAGFNEVQFNGFPLGSNTYTDPLFTNGSDLITNRNGAPNCTGFTNTTACMGWNAATSTLTTPSVISDLAAACASCTGKGFQRPTVTCAANADYPNYLKGIVYLHADNGFTAGTTITEKAGLVSKPCNM